LGFYYFPWVERSGCILCGIRGVRFEYYFFLLPGTGRK